MPERRKRQVNTMAGNPQTELYHIQSELRSIIKELNSISSGLRDNFSGISNDVCANRIANVATQCQNRLNTLYNATVKADESTGGGFR